MRRRLLIESRAVLGALARPGIIALVWLLLAAAALWLGHFKGTQAVPLASLASAVGAYVVSFSFGLGGLALLVDARALCLPRRFSILSHAGSAVAAALLLTIVAPGILLGLAAHSTAPALLIVAGALAGLLAPRTPYSTLVVIWVAILLPRAAHVWQQVLRVTTALGTVPLLLLACTALLALVVWRWAGIVRGNPRALERASRVGPMLSAMQRGDSALAARSDAWWWFPAPPRSAAPASPARIVSTCLGAPYTPGVQSRLHFGLEAGLTVGFMAVVFGVILGLRGSWDLGWLAGALFLLVLTWGVFSERIARVFGRGGGELAELALLPGFGNRRGQLRALYRAALGAPLLLSLVLSAFAVVASLVGQHPGADHPGTLSLAVSITLLGIAVNVTVLAGATSLWARVLTIACVLLLAAWLIVGRHPVVYPATFLALSLVACLIVAVSAYRLAALPHPFVIRR